MSLLLGVMLLMTLQAPVESEVAFEGAGKLKLFGTLTMPANSAGKKLPAMLLLPGSGPTDRNGNQMPSLTTNVLRQISDSLAANGIASLRFDKRATQLYRDTWPKKMDEIAEFFKWENFVDDATSGYRYLTLQSGIDSKRVGIIGHSEGAEIALQIGSNLSKTSEVPAAIITLGGAGRPMGPILVEQISRIMDKQQLPLAVKKQYLANLQEVIDQVKKDGTYPTGILPGLKALFNPSTPKIMHSYCAIDPTNLAKAYPGPVLLINGAHDSQVSPERDTPLLKDALKSRPSGTVEMLIVPDASHNLKSTTAGNDDAFEGPVSSVALDKIKQFLKKVFQP